MTRGYLVWVRLTAVWIVVMGATVAQARDAVVSTSDGRTFEGEVLHEDDSHVTLSVSGIRVKISRADIVEIQYQQTIEQQYRQRRALVSDEDVDGRYELAYWLYENKAYAIASRVLTALGDQFPEDQRIVRLKSLVAASVAATQPAPSDVPRDVPRIEKPNVASNLVPHPVAVEVVRTHKQRMTPQQINLIKVYEIDLETEPTVFVPREVMQEVFTRYAHHPSVPSEPRDRTRFLDSPGHRKLAMLFNLRARELYRQVDVRTEPLSLRDFRTKFHQRYVLNYCGTVACHGRTGVGHFELIREDPNSEQTVYTNFLTLQTTSIGNHDMINRQQPDRSLLVQYGMARDRAATPHPEVAGWTPKFQNRENPLYDGLQRWIDSLWKPTPDYDAE